MADLTPGARARGDGVLRRHHVGQLGIVAATFCLVVLTWLGTYSAMEAERRSARAQIEAKAFDQAFAIGEKFTVQMLGYEQAVRVLEREWERDPAGFRLQDWRRTLFPIDDPAVDLFITDATGTIVASSSADLTGMRLNDRDFFRQAASLSSDNGDLYVDRGPSDGLAGRWSITFSRRLDTKAGAFAGTVGAFFHSDTLADYFARTNMSPGAVMLLVGRAGYLRAASSEIAAYPGQNIAASDLFRALGSGTRSWIGPTEPGEVVRIHGFYRVPELYLTVVVGYDRRTALHASDAWQRGAIVFALGVTIFLVLIATLLVRDLRAVREREQRMARSRAELEQAYGDLKAAKSHADVKTGQLEATFAGMSDGVTLLDGELRVMRWNERFCELAGVPWEKLRVGMPFSTLLQHQAALGEFGAVDIQTEVSRRLGLLTAQTRPTVVERQRPNGQTIELRRTPLPAGGYVTLYSDISARKAAEKAERRARAAAEQAAEEKSRFAAIVSHEIRTPLNTLLNSLAILAHSALPPQSRRVVLLARQAGEALQDLLNDILELAKLDAGGLQLRQSRFEIRPLLAGVLDLFRPQIADGRTRLRLSVAPDVPERIEGDRVRLRQMLMNLVSNAVKYSDPGEICLRANVEAGALVLRVCDPGPAIPDRDRVKLFEAFFRLERLGEEAKPGSGLGLAICRKLATLLGGGIGCDPAPGGGNAFWIRLPCGETETTVGEVTAPAPLILPRTRILLVDDLASNRTIATTLLERFGHLVEVAGSGPEAVATAGSAPFDIVLLDVFMPGTDGLETARRLRTLDGPAATIPIVALTADGDDGTRVRCLAAGMQDVVYKPIDPAALQAVIGRLVWTAVLGGGGGQVASGAELDFPAIEASRLADLRATMSGPALVQLLDSCLADLEAKTAELRQALDVEDGEDADGALHALIGVASSYGFAALAHCAGLMRRALRNGEIGEAAVLLPEVERVLAEAKIAAAAAFATEQFA